MNNIDITSLYSTQAALQSINLEDPDNSFFTYSLVSLTAAFLKNQNVFFSKPPISDESGIKSLGKFAKLLKKEKLINNFNTISENEKEKYIKTTEKWIEKKYDRLEKLVKNTLFWDDPKLKTWVNWHKNNEWSNRRKRLGDIVDKEFTKYIKLLGVEDSNDEKRFTLDVIMRGYYYLEAYESNIWLHPLRTTYLLPELQKNPTENNSLDFDLICIIIGIMQENSIKKNNYEDKTKNWIAIVSDARESSNTGHDLHNEISKKWGFNKWENRADIVNNWLTVIVQNTVVMVPEDKRIYIPLIKFFEYSVPKLITKVAVKGDEYESKQKGKKIISLCGFTN